MDEFEKEVEGMIEGGRRLNGIGQVSWGNNEGLVEGEDGAPRLGPAGLYQGAGKDTVKRLTYSAQEVVDMVIANPGMGLSELGKLTGYTVPYLSVMMQSDAFQNRLAERRKELVDPVLVANLEEKLKAATSRSLDVILDKLHKAIPDADYALEVAKVTTKALGFGAREKGPVLNQQFVFQVPSTPKSVEDWENMHGQGGVIQGMIEEKREES